MRTPELFLIKSFSDHRGKIEFSNEFDFSNFKRFYIISPANENQIRAWQGHKLENKAFMALSGKLKLVLIEVLNFELEQFGETFEYILDASLPQIIHVPGGYLNGFQFLTIEAKLMVFSSFTLEESLMDDYRFDSMRFYDWG